MKYLIVIVAIFEIYFGFGNTAVAIRNTFDETKIDEFKTNYFDKVENANYWHKVGMSQLKKILATTDGDLTRLKAKNIIIFIGDGMGPTTVTAARIYKGQLRGISGEEESLIFDSFPYTGLAKTYNVNRQVPDSAGTATALFTGVKTNFGSVGMDATAIKSNSTQGKLTTIMEWAAKVNKRIGIVTTTRITHATPAASYAKVYKRDWECDTKIPNGLEEIYKDIARQLVENSPGNKFNVIMGGGLSPMGSQNINEQSSVQFGGDTETVCGRADGRNLTNEWLNIEPKDKRAFVRTRDELLNLNLDNVDHLLGLFRNNHITYSIARQNGEPTLAEMVQQAINVLNRPKSNGFVLMVEGGRIDQAHHQNYARAALREVVELDKAVQIALNLTNKDETLIIVTADHSHALTLNGYPMRGSDIFGFANKTEKINPYETLTYANGPGFYEHRMLSNFNKNDSHFHQTLRHNTWLAVDELGDKRLSPTYRHLATIPLDSETHGGEDVTVFATGPGSNLIRGVFEQNYIAYVISYVGCMGPAKDFDNVCLNFKYNKFYRSTANSNIKFKLSLFIKNYLILIITLILITN